MPSTDPGRRRRAQRGSISLVEALVASALLGIVGMVGLTAWDTAINSSKTAVRLAWAQCSISSLVSSLQISLLFGAICSNGTSTRFESLPFLPTSRRKCVANSADGGGSNCTCEPLTRQFAST